MRILLVSDIHGNYPALQAVADHFSDAPFDLIVNGGDTTVYAPFPNQTIDWLRAHNARSILGNTDRLVLDLLRGKTFAKPSKAEKRVMYGWTASELTEENHDWLRSLPESLTFPCPAPAGPISKYHSLGVFHGSPADPDEFLFADTPDCRFRELAASVSHGLVTVGHSHSPFHKFIDGVHFVNPGSTGRMFDGDTGAGCAIIEVADGGIRIELHRISYPVETVIAELERLRLPPIYQEMYRRARKLN